MTNNFKNLQAQAKDRATDPEVIKIVEEMEAEVSFKNRVTGTLLTLLLWNDGEEL